MSSSTLPSPGSPTTTRSFTEGRRSQKMWTSLLPTGSSERSFDSELQSPALLSSESLEVPTVIVDSPQVNTYRSKYPTSHSERSKYSPSVSRNNSLVSEAGGGFEEWRSDQTFQFEIPKPKAGHWEEAYRLAREHDTEMCDAWREGIDKLLIFAGLFSAALVAFLTISCPMLNADPNDTQNELLLRITVQMQLQYGANNVTLPPLPPSSNTFQPPFAVIVTNMCWFLSLTIALGTVLFGTVCLQWIREFERDPHLGCKEAFEFRQMRYEGLIGWGIPFLISSLPLLLQSCLLLFFLGLCFFLQSFDPVIAAAVSVLVALIVVFLGVTMMLPALQCITSSSKNHDQRSSLCPFKSPHAFRFTVFVAWSSLILIDIFRLFSSNPDALKKKKEFFTKILRDGSSWTSVDMAWLDTSHPKSHRSPKYDCPHSPAALAWLAGTYASSHDALCTFYHCLRDSKSSTAIETLERLTSRNLNWAIDYDVEYSKDIRSALTLDHFVNVSPQLHDSLLAHRIELFVRILNQGLMPRVGRPPGQTTAVYSLFKEELLQVPFDFVGENDFVTLDDTCKLQLIRTFFSYLEAKEIHDFLTKIVIKIVHTTMKFKRTRPLTSDQMLREELSTFNKKLQYYLNKPDETENFKDDVKKLVKKYVDGFGRDGYTGRFSSFKTSFTCLARQV